MPERCVAVHVTWTHRVHHPFRLCGKYIIARIAIEEVTMKKQTAGLGMIAVMVVVFTISEVPAWVWAFAVLLLVIQVAVIARARAIEARR